jgi:hypothetical protein
MNIEEWLRIADGWRDTDEAPGELIRALASAVTRVQERHKSDGSPTFPWCWECDTNYPCPTVRALNGEG